MSSDSSPSISTPNEQAAAAPRQEGASAGAAQSIFDGGADWIVQRRYVTAALMMVMVLASMEQTVTSTAMPTIIGELHGLQHYAWVASVYLLAATVSMPLYGRLCDVLGRKPVILGAIGLFIVSSALAAMSHSMIQLIVFRGMQGLGAGGIMPVVLTILGDIFTLEERARVQGLFSAIWGGASLAGPLLGAFLVIRFGWRSIFLVNLPLGVISALVLMLKYHDREKPHSTDLDLPGVVSLALACSVALGLVSGLGPQGWSWPWIAGLSAVVIGSGIYFVRNEYRSSNPIMPPALMVRREIGPAMLGSLLLGVSFLGIDTYVPLFVQGGRGGGPGAAASVVTPIMFTWALSGVVAAPLAVRWGFRRLAACGTVVAAVGVGGLFVCAILNVPSWALTWVLAIAGLGFGPTSMSLLLSAQGAVAWQQRGIITSGIQFFRTIGGAIGVGLLGAVLNLLLAPRLAHVATKGLSISALMDPEFNAKLPVSLVHSVRDAIASSLIWIFAALFVFALLGIVVSLLMQPNTPDHTLSASEALEAAVG